MFDPKRGGWALALHARQYVATVIKARNSRIYDKRSLDPQLQGQT